jgi:prevent-host-death family protein
MSTISIRELRNRLGQHIAAVRNVATITVTDHGRAVARVSPVGQPTALEQLIADGMVQLPAHRKRPAPEPVAADVSLTESLPADRR